MTNLILLAALLSQVPTSAQPKVSAGPSEPDWPAILDAHFGLRMWADLANPVQTDPLQVPGLFEKAGPGPVKYTPTLALGLEVPIHGGWYLHASDPKASVLVELWTYRDKHTARDLESPDTRPVTLAAGSRLEFDPGDKPFGLYVSNDQFRDSAFTEPRMVQARNERLAAQPYKVMMYPVKDRTSGAVVPNAYWIGWEYSTNDDFQDVVTKIENVRLFPAPR
jgi:hypothetical protein